MALGDYLAGLGLAATIRKFHRAHHATCNHRRRCGSMEPRDFLLDENGFYQQSHPVDRKWTSFFAYRGGHCCIRVERRKQTSDDFPRIEKRRGSSRAHVHPRGFGASRGGQVDPGARHRDRSKRPGRLLFAVTYLNLELAYVTGNKARTVNAELAYA